jgi:hypothetical protein
MRKRHCRFSFRAASRRGFSRGGFSRGSDREGLSRGGFWACPCAASLPRLLAGLSGRVRIILCERFRQEGEAGTDAGCGKKNRGTDAAIFLTARFFAAQKNVPPLAPAVRHTRMAAHRKKTRSRTPVSEPGVFYPLSERGERGRGGGMGEIMAAPPLGGPR